MKRLSDRRGITLIELALTVVVISVGLVGLMILFENVTKGVMQADMNVMATYLTHEKLEQIVLDKWRDGYAEVEDEDYPYQDIEIEVEIEDKVIKKLLFRRSTEIVEVSREDLMTPEEDSGYKRVEVTVSWDGGAITIPTLLASYK